MKFRYFLCFSVSLELTLGDYCLDQANSSSPNDSLGENLLQHNPCIRAILFLSFDIFVCFVSNYREKQTPEQRGPESTDQLRFQINKIAGTTSF